MSSIERKVKDCDRIAKLVEEIIDPAIERKRISDLVPNGYVCNLDSGVFIEGDEHEQITTTPIWVEALSRDGEGENWGRYVAWKDPDGTLHQEAIGAGRFHSKGNELAQDFADRGLSIVPRKEIKLLQYLAAFNISKRMKSATATGWLGEAFILPAQTINAPDTDRIVYQPIEYQAAANAIYSQGTPQEWQDKVARPIAPSPLARFAVAASLSAPLRYRANVESGGFHFYGQTSRGKTTVLQAAASVWGNAADPNIVGGHRACIQRWNATKNGLEGVASSFNDLPLIIDEVNEADSREFGRTIYQLMAGTGKARAIKSGAGRERRHWRVTVLSAGELSVDQFIHAAGIKVMGGQLVRLVDIPAYGLFDDKDTVDRIKRACGEYFGAVGPEFLRRFIDEGMGDALENDQLEKLADSIGQAETTEQCRVRWKIALVALAGEAAITLGVLPWKGESVLESCREVYRRWLRSGEGCDDATRGIVNIKEFIQAHGDSRFSQVAGNDKTTIRDRAGWKDDDVYHFTPKAFDQACGGVQPYAVKEALKDRKLAIFSDEEDRLRNRITVDGQRPTVVSVKAEILSWDCPVTEDDGTGAGQQEND